MFHTYANHQTILRPISRTAFENGFNPTSNVSFQPAYWTESDKEAEVHRFWDSDASAYVTTSTVTAGDGTYLQDTDANFGVIESGEAIEPDDIVWNDTDDSWAKVDYLDITTAAVSGTASGGSATTLVDSGADFSSVLVGHLIKNTTDGSWGIVTVVNDTTDTITVAEWLGGTDNEAENGDSFQIGIADKIYFKALNEFTTRGVRGGSDNTFSADDTYRVQDKFNTVPSFMIKPVPNATDTTGTESLTIIFSSEPQQMIEDDDPCCVEDNWSSYILDYAWYLALKRQPDRLGEAEALEAAYNMKIARMKQEQSIMEYGQADNIFDHIEGGIASQTSFRAQFTQTL
jgi:hypothetical protein